MIEIRKIMDKSDYEVIAQEGYCYVTGKPTYYQGHDCMKDCNAYGEPPYFKSPKY